MNLEHPLPPKEQLRKNWTLVRWGVSGCARAIGLMIRDATITFFKKERKNR